MLHHYCKNILILSSKQNKQLTLNKHIHHYLVYLCFFYFQRTCLAVFEVVRFTGIIWYSPRFCPRPRTVRRNILLENVPVVPGFQPVWGREEHGEQSCDLHCGVLRQGLAALSSLRECCPQ